MWTRSLSNLCGHVPYRIYVDTFPNEFMWTRSLTNLCGHVRYRIYVDMFPIELMWTYSISNLCGHVPYQIYVDTFHIEFMWTCSLTNLCGHVPYRIMWTRSLTNLCGHVRYRIYVDTFHIEFHPSRMKNARNRAQQISTHRCSQTLIIPTVTKFKIARKLSINKSLPNLLISDKRFSCLCEVLSGRERR